MKNRAKSICIFLLLVVAGCSASKEVKEEAVRKEPSLSNDLFSEIQHMDSVMFNAFNAHNTIELGKTFSETLEFYHDKGGLSDYKTTMENFDKLFEKNKTTGLRRDLVKGTLEVYPIKDYGAIEVCQHQFCHVENGKDDCGTFKNVMVWQKKDRQWKVTRVISYDH